MPRASSQPEVMCLDFISRSARLPDPLRIARCRRAPELGPRVLFFSGGTALRDTSRKLVGYTHNSIHLITPFDSGGSSAHLRRASADSGTSCPVRGARR